MPKSISLTIAAVLAATSVVDAVEHPDSSDWSPLIAPDFSNCIDPAHWKMNEGVMEAKGHHTLWTKKSYGDFILDLEFKVTAESNSGVFLRSGDIKNVLKAIEIQIHETTDGSKYGMVGAIYDAMPPSKSAAKPVGEWNRLTMTCKGSLISATLNTEQIIHADLNNWPDANKNPDGTPNKFPVALKDYARKGPIGFQGLHGKAKAPVYYRKIRIKPLD